MASLPPKSSTATPNSGDGCRLVHDHGPLPGDDPSFGVGYDGESLWVAAGAHIRVLDPESGQTRREVDVEADAGTAFDGTHIYQIAEDRILRIEAESGKVVASIPAPGNGQDGGLAWAEGSLWVGQHLERKIHQIDPATGAIIKTIESDRFVTGVSFSEGELWHATWEHEESEIRRVDREDGQVLERVKAPAGVLVTGLAAMGGRRFACGSGSSGRVRVLELE